MDQALFTKLKACVKGEVVNDTETLTRFSYDASIFEVIPEAVVAPMDVEDVKRVVKFIKENKKQHPTLSVTARSAGTDMGGGPLTESIVLSFTQHFNKILGLDGNSIRIQPGVYFRDFEKVTLKNNLLFPAYPVSKEICALGGIINNNSGGEKSLEYGKTEKYVKKMKMVLSDGEEYEFKKLNETELRAKLALTGFEGEIYRNIYRLINANYDVIKQAKPTVSKNSSGYSLWNVYDKDTRVFDLTQLFTGAQGTLGVLTEASLELVPVRKHAEMLVVFMEQKDIDSLGDVINTVLPTEPESFETYDDNTLKLAVKYFPEFGKKLGTTNILSTALHFLPEILMVLRRRVPKLVLQIEFTGDDLGELKTKVEDLKEKLNHFNLKMKVAGNEMQSKKYWLIRRDSFRLLKDKVKDKHAAPFIDDFVVEPKYLSEFLPKLNKIMAKYPSFIFTIAGHIGDGNFHIIPLVDIEDEKQREIISILGKEVYDLVFEYHGVMTGEHNDGLIRTPYLKSMFGAKIYDLFVETKKIFDPDNIFNPGKKVNATMTYSMSHIRKNW